MSEIAISHIAKLARLDLSQQEIENFSQQLSKMLHHFEQISQVDTKDIVPLVTPTEIENILRADEVRREVAPESILEGAPQRTGHLFTVPPVV